ncbi:MAG: 2-C-methyl-D-erythritol 4-phosphate cytidylyltransferase [Melioribacteraceae bacterium]|nr:2-C-methyl-D-erythritol 4-phosphate cytidylyltransferase [Melioribacteraceae bacterium]
MKNIAIIPSGGSGLRAGANIPKQYLKFNGKELIAYTLEVFQSCELIDEIIIPAKKEYFKLLNQIKEKYSISKLIKIVEGGKERQDSVYNALSHISTDEKTFVAVHDAARPLLPINILNTALKSVQKFDNIVIAINAKDTLINGDEFVDSFIERKSVFYVQTPQIFKYENLKKAMELAKKENFYGTDESMLVKRAGFEVKIAEGSALNFKVTTESDIELFKAITKV